MAQQRAEQTIAPIKKAVTVGQSVEDAFRIFTDQIGSWWPLKSHSMGGEKAVSCGMDGAVGGYLFEELADGTRLNWGEVLTWDFAADGRPSGRGVHEPDVQRAEPTQARTDRIAFEDSFEGPHRVSVLASACRNRADRGSNQTRESARSQ